VYGAGLSGAISDSYPKVKEKYKKCYKKYGPDKMFGKYQVMRVSWDLAVANIFSQYNYGNSKKTGKIYTDVKKLVKCIQVLATKYKNCEILIPIGIGCGLAGADWSHVERSIINLKLDNIRFVDTKTKSTTFKVMKNVTNNRELKRINNNAILEIKTRETEDLLDIERQIWRLEDIGYKVILQSPKGNLLPSRALGKYTREHVDVSVPMNGKKVNMRAFKAKLISLKSMMSHKEYVDIPMYEMAYPSAFDHKIPETDEDSDVVVKTVEKTVYLDRVYTFSMYGKIVNHYGFIKRLAESYKIPLATVVKGKIVDPNDKSYLLDGFSEESKELLNLKYEELDENKKAALYKFFGIKGYKVSDYENFLYSSYNIAQFVKGEFDLVDKVDAEGFMNMLEMFKIPNAYDLIYDLAEKGMLVNLDNYPELKHFEIAVYYERYGSDEEDDDILD
jgi:hypothetical protein